MTEPEFTELKTWGPDYRLEALSLAVRLYSGRPQDYFGDEAVVRAAGEFLHWLTARAVTLRVGDPVISEQGHPARRIPLKRTGANMAVTMKDTDQATYPAPSESDSKGFPVTGDVITIAEDSAGAVVSQVSNPDGSVTFVAVAPGSANVSWTDGVLSFADAINVTAGDAATLVVGAPVIEPQPAETEPPAPVDSGDGSVPAAS
jgi:hypothetical protein